MNNNNNITIPFQVDISNCNKEPIHIPGYIQPHGVFLALREEDLTILQISDNIFSLFGLNPEELLNQHLSYLLDMEQIKLLQECLSVEDLPIVNPVEFTIKLGGKSEIYDGIIHRSDGVLILELEPSLSERSNAFFKFYHLVKLATSKLQDASTVTELSQILVKEIKRITGFDRVMIYRFDENWNGVVIAEEKPEYLTAYLGLHYPASDIPKQARNLYSRNWLRLIPNVNYQPVAIVPTNNPLNDLPLDLSRSVLRSVSPLHVEYMHNMGVTASMSISIMKEKKLWGLIACHHQSPKYLPYEIRSACEFLAQIASLDIGAKEDSEDVEYKIQLKSIQSKLVEYM